MTLFNPFESITVFSPFWFHHVVLITVIPMQRAMPTIRQLDGVRAKGMPTVRVSNLFNMNVELKRLMAGSGMVLAGANIFSTGYHLSKITQPQ
jgi:hypothetical protein